MYIYAQAFRLDHVTMLYIKHFRLKNDVGLVIGGDVFEKKLLSY